MGFSEIFNNEIVQKPLWIKNQARWAWGLENDERSWYEHQIMILIIESDVFYIFLNFRVIGWVFDIGISYDFKHFSKITVTAAETNFLGVNDGKF